MEDREYDVVLSFAGEDRDYVRKVAEFLGSQGVSYFYDEDNAVDLWGKNLTEEFNRIYSQDSRYAVLFISDHYERKMWTRHERRAALAHALQEDSEYVLPARFDDTEIKGLLPTISYIDLRNLSPIEFALRVCEKIGHDLSSSKLNAVPSPSSTELSGEVVFDYSNHDGKYRIGKNSLLFETRWSKASDTSIHCLNDSSSIAGIALAPKDSHLDDITDASTLDYTSRIRSPEIGRFVVLQNVKGFYAAIQIIGIKDDSRSDDHDELHFRYWILPDSSSDFSNLESP